VINNLGPLRTAMLYCLSTALVLLLLLALPAAVPYFGVYCCLSFWTLVAMDFYRSQVQELQTGRFPLEDRILGYLFVAPFILPARAYQLAMLPARQG